jgi:hypothetical protein
MVKFGIEDFSSYSDVKRPPHLVIYTNTITDEILKMVDTKKTQHIIFSVPEDAFRNNMDTTIEFLASSSNWYRFAENLQSLEFYGKLVDKQFTAEHLNKLTGLRRLSILYTNYKIFDNEDVSNLPMISDVRFCGYMYQVLGSNSCTFY